MPSANEPKKSDFLLKISEKSMETIQNTLVSLPANVIEESIITHNSPVLPVIHQHHKSLSNSLIIHENSLSNNIEKNPLE